MNCVVYGFTFFEGGTLFYDHPAVHQQVGDGCLALNTSNPLELFWFTELAERLLAQKLGTVNSSRYDL